MKTAVRACSIFALALVSAGLSFYLLELAEMLARIAPHALKQLSRLATAMLDSAVLHDPQWRRHLAVFAVVGLVAVSTLIFDVAIWIWRHRGEVAEYLKDVGIASSWVRSFLKFARAWLF